MVSVSYTGISPNREQRCCQNVDQTGISLAKESNKVWKESQSDPPMIAKPDFRTAKIMYSIFFDGRGPVAQILVPKGRTVTGNFYTNSCLLEVEHHLTRRRPKTGAKDLRLLHDNARPHKTKQVQEKITSMGMIELEHPPYSPDFICFQS